MCKSLKTLKTNIRKGSNRLSKTTIKNIINEGCFERIELAYSYNGKEVHKGTIIENPVEWFNSEYDRLKVRYHKTNTNPIIITLSVHSNLWYHLYIDLEKHYPFTNNSNNKPAKQNQEQQTPQENETGKYIDTMQKKFKTGEGTAEELKAYYIFMRDNMEEVKTALYEKICNSEKYKNKRKNTKLELTDQLYDNMIEKMVYFVQNALSFMADFKDPKGSRERAIEEIIFNATDEMIQTQYNNTITQNEERDERYKNLIESLKNPQTLEDFRQAKLYRKNKTLTDEEQEHFDYLTAIANKKKREQQANVLNVEKYFGEIFKSIYDFIITERRYNHEKYNGF